MLKDDFYYFGKILKTYGNKGEVMIHLDVDDPLEYLHMESVYLDLHGERIPFFIESVELKHNNKAVIAFQDFNSNEDSECLAGLEMYLPLNSLPPLSGNRFYFHEITGFHVIDSVYGDIGVVENVLELPHQALLQINNGEKEILIPVVDEVISQVNREQKTLNIDAPEGLIAIYLD
ncbi:MAG: ribosome maturation factor RimM [Bacteroidota bacterium]